MLPFEFIVDGPPVSQQARRRERLQLWKETVRQEAERYWLSGDLPVSGAIMLKVTYLYDRVGMDVDNIVKPIQDALEGLVYFDDSQVTDMLSRKRDLSGNFVLSDVSGVLAEGLSRGSEFLHILVERAPDQEVLS